MPPLRVVRFGSEASAVSEIEKVEVWCGEKKKGEGDSNNALLSPCLPASAFGSLERRGWGCVRRRFEGGLVEMVMKRANAQSDGRITGISGSWFVYRGVLYRVCVSAREVKV
jgi:hypothetical protein